MPYLIAITQFRVQIWLGIEVHLRIALWMWAGLGSADLGGIGKCGMKVR